MRATRLIAIVAGVLLSAHPVAALESSMKASSPMVPAALWRNIADFCGMAAWNPAVESCQLSPDGKQRTIHVYGSATTFVSQLERWDDVNRSFTFKSLSGLPSVKNYHATVTVTEQGSGSILTLVATYDADDMSDADAKNAIDRRMYNALCSGPLLCIQHEQTASNAETVTFSGAAINGKSVVLKGYLRRPPGTGPFPAVVLLHGCNGFADLLDRRWGAKLVDWGYVTLTVDSLSPRGLRNTCGGGRLPVDLYFDAYKALDFLTTRPSVEAGRAALLGFSQGGFLTLSSVERGPIERAAKNKFKAAIAFYPPCGSMSGPMTIPTLVLIGERDDWTPAEACRKLADGDDDLGVARSKGKGISIQLKIFPDAYHAFDVPSLKKPISYFGHHIAYDKAATDQSSDILRKFLASNLREQR